MSGKSAIFAHAFGKLPENVSTDLHHRKLSELTPVVHRPLSAKPEPGKQGSSIGQGIIFHIGMI